MPKFSAPFPRGVHAARQKHAPCVEMVRKLRANTTIKLIINDLYTDFKTSIITSSFQTPFIPVRRGVLQGDCLSPLLFNMCFNTFIQHIKVERYRQFGFSFKLMNPVHWFQFADDAAVITTQESENQHLLNRFSVWCQWSNMFIRAEKCSTFGIKKSATKSIQFLPKLLINGVLIPTVKIGESFQYLGRYFNFDMSDDVHKSEIISHLEDLMSIIDSKPLHPKNKLLLYSRFVLSKLSWHFTISNISQTWVKENIDSVVNSYVRRWLEIPISGTLSTVFMSRNRFGLHIIPPSVKFLQCQTTLRNALKTSPNVGNPPVQTKTFSMTFIPQLKKSLKIFARRKNTSYKINYPRKVPFSKASQNLSYHS